MLLLLQDEVIQFDHIGVLLNNISYECEWTAPTYLISELISGTVNANDEVSAVYFMGACLGLCFQMREVVVGKATARGRMFGSSRKR